MDKLENLITELIVDYFRSCCKPEQQRLIGTEFEKILFDKDGCRVPYRGPKGIGKFLKSFAEEHNFCVLEKNENGEILGLKTSDGIITLEPGAQIELSTNTWKNLHDLGKEWESHSQKILKKCREFDYRYLSIGIDPIHSAEKISLIPKKRYEIMAQYLPTKGRLAHWMMRLTAAIQVSLDYTSEEEAMEMFKIGLGISPFVTAMFANSPIIEGKKSGYLSYRSYVWSHTDPDRCGTLDCLLKKDDLRFQDYAKIITHVPLMFRYDAQNNIMPAQGESLYQWMKRENREPSLEEIKMPIQQIFTEIRLKSFLEFRGMDSPIPELNMAVPALWVGLMYDKKAREKAWQLYQRVRHKDHHQLWMDIATHGLKKDCVFEMAQQLLEISENSLRERNIVNGEQEDESLYLKPLRKLVEQRKTPADILLEKWDQIWQGEIPAFLEYLTVT